MILSKGLEHGKDFILTNNSEFLREGHCWQDFIWEDCIVIGSRDGKDVDELFEIAEGLVGIDIANAFHILHMDKRWNHCNMIMYVYPSCGYGSYYLPKGTNALYAFAQNLRISKRELKSWFWIIVICKWRTKWEMTE